MTRSAGGKSRHPYDDDAAGHCVTCGRREFDQEGEPTHRPSGPAAETPSPDEREEEVTTKQKQKEGSYGERLLKLFREGELSAAEAAEKVGCSVARVYEVLREFAVPRLGSGKYGWGKKAPAKKAGTKRAKKS